MKKKPNCVVLPKPGRLVADSSTAEGHGVPSDPKTAQEPSSPLRCLSMSQHSDNLLAFLNEDRTRQKFCDVSVLVGGTVYRAHKAVLAHGSSYFHAELSKSPATVTHVTLDHVEDSVFQYLLGFLYTSECVVAETDLPALAEAARFLDMMDILKLLCEDGTAVPSHGETSRPSEVEAPSCDAAGADTEIRSKSSLQDGVDKGNSAGQIASTFQKSATTRRSARTRRTPTKYKKDDGKSSVSSPQEQQRSGSSGKGDENKAESVTEVHQDVKDAPKPPQGDDVMEEDAEEDEQGDVNTGGVSQRNMCEASGTDRTAGEEGSHAESTEPPSGQDQEVHIPPAATANKSPEYPEGLAPVIIQTASKKTLKCPKCEKTFDRAGGFLWS